MTEKPSHTDPDVLLRLQELLKSRKPTLGDLHRAIEQARAEDVPERFRELLKRLEEPKSGRGAA